MNTRANIPGLGVTPRQAPRLHRQPMSGAALLHKLAPAGAALLVLALHFIIPGVLPVWQRLLGSFSGVLMAYLGTQYLTQTKFDRLPYIEFGLVQIYMFWGLPVLFEDVTERYPIHHQGITLALISIALFVTIMLAAYPLGLALGRRARPLLDKIYPGQVGAGMSLLYWPWLLLAMFGNTGLTARLPRAVMHPFVAISTYFPLLGYTAIHTRGDRRRAWLFPVATILLATAGMISGRMRFVLLPIVVSGVIYLVSKRRFPWRMLGVIFLLFILLQPAKHAYRALAWSEAEHRQSFNVELTATRWWEALVTTWEPGEGVQDNQGSVTDRLNMLAPIAVVFEMVPGLVPHVGADYWKLLLVSPLPRVVYPDKPNFTEAINGRYSITFGIQNEQGASTTTSAFPLVSDGYWCYGWPGVIFVGLVAGLLLGFNTRCYSLGNWVGLSLALSMFAELRPLSNLVGMLGGIFQRVVGLLLICWLIWFFSFGFASRARRASSPARPPGPGQVT